MTFPKPIPEPSASSRVLPKKEHATLNHKLRVLAYYQNLVNSKTSGAVTKTISHFENLTPPLELKRTTLYKWIQSQDKIKETYEHAGPSTISLDQRSGRKQGRRVKNAQVERALVLFCQKMMRNNLPCSGDIIRTKLQQYQEKFGGEAVKGSNGWLESFCRT